MTVLGLLAAFVAGVVIAVQSDSAEIGLFSGLGIAFVLQRLHSLSRAVTVLRAQVAELQRARTEASPDIAMPAEPQSVPPEAAPAWAIAPGPAASPPAAAAAAEPAPEPVRESVAGVDADDAVSPGALARTAPAPATPDVFDKLAAAVKRWFTEGNVPVKIGMLVLFAGIAALLKLAADQGWFTLPIELRLSGIALAAIGGLAFGWRQREARRAFALSLQGGAIGVLLLTVFAAFRLYHLLPPEAAFALLLVLVAGTGVLAVRQEALALAVLGILAGFAAPILISTGGGNHVVLFAYYALLNLAILAISWQRPWRALNLLGFFFTYAIGTAWGVLRYHSALFASTEPFLLLYFAIYLAIPILYARQRDPSRRDLVDGTLLFGNPLVAFSLQAVLLEGERLSLAYSALVLAATYVLLAWRLLPRERLRVLGESFAVLAVGFATLAVPLAFSARTTACTFALEGAALVWLGLRQQRRLPRIGGLVLQALAAAAFSFGSLAIAGDDAIPIANGTFMSALLIAAAAFASAWLHDRAATKPPLALPLYLWGLLWWCAAALYEIERFGSAVSQAPAQLGFTASTAALAALAYRYLPRPALAWTAAVALAAALLVVPGLSGPASRLYSPLALVAFTVYAACGVATLRLLRDGATAPLRVAHLGWLWTWTFAATLGLDQFVQDARLADGWRGGLVALPLVVAFLLALRRPRLLAPPLGARFDDHRGLLLVMQAAFAAIAFVALLPHEGGSAPLPFVPILNPLELAQIALLLGLARWLADAATATTFARWRGEALALAGFAFVTTATLRAVHHLGGVPWDESLWESNLAQTALTIVWSLAGVIAWILGSRRRHRLLWLAGAVLMGLVLAKLLLIDRARLGNLFGIASFIVYGLLCTVIGYLAPAPPRAEKEAA